MAARWSWQGGHATRGASGGGSGGGPPAARGRPPVGCRLPGPPRQLLSAPQRRYAPKSSLGGADGTAVPPGAAPGLRSPPTWAWRPCWSAVGGARRLKRRGACFVSPGVQRGTLQASERTRLLTRPLGAPPRRVMQARRSTQQQQQHEARQRMQARQIPAQHEWRGQVAPAGSRGAAVPGAAAAHRPPSPQQCCRRAAPGILVRGRSRGLR